MCFLLFFFWTVILYIVYPWVDHVRNGLPRYVHGYHYFTYKHVHYNAGLNWQLITWSGCASSKQWTEACDLLEDMQYLYSDNIQEREWCPIEYLHLVCQYILSFHVCVELISHPTTPVHVVAKLYSYKPYMVGAKFKNTYPRFDCKTPKEVKTILDEFAASIIRPTDSYNPDTNVISAPKNYSHLRQGLITVTQQDLTNPHVNFFVENNPGWAKVCL